jgi:hypothetical protein
MDRQPPAAPLIWSSAALASPSSFWPQICRHQAVKILTIIQRKRAWSKEARPLQKVSLIIPAHWKYFVCQLALMMLHQAMHNPPQSIKLEHPHLKNIACIVLPSGPGLILFQPIPPSAQLKSSPPNHFFPHIPLPPPHFSIPISPQNLFSKTNHRTQTHHFPTFTLYSPRSCWLTLARLTAPITVPQAITTATLDAMKSNGLRGP